jgi:hypothetical protein
MSPGIQFGDWLSPEGKTDYTLIATAYWAYDVTLMQQMAHATGRTQDEEKYARLFEKIRAAFAEEICARRRICGRRRQHAIAFGSDQQSRCEEPRAATRKPATCSRCT